jgi:hypothetical protein
MVTVKPEMAPEKQEVVSSHERHMLDSKFQDSSHFCGSMSFDVFSGVAQLAWQQNRKQTRQT